MLNKLLSFVREHDMLAPGDAVVCAVSGGADSIALLFALYLLSSKLEIKLSAAHFNHKLRGEESDSDEAFVQSFCEGYGIPLHVQSQRVLAGKKGLEAAAREARYAFLNTLPGKIATAHTADDNAETVLMHMLRGTGLKGLGGITPVMGNVIRPMLSLTRQDVLDFISEYSLPFVEDSSNGMDHFLRNRIRHHVMPVLKDENPRLFESVSAMALRLREDEEYLSSMAEKYYTEDISFLREMPSAIRSRVLAQFLLKCGVKEPSADQIRSVEQLLYSDRPSAVVQFSGGVLIGRNYDCLQRIEEKRELSSVELNCPGEIVIPELGVKILCEPAKQVQLQTDGFTVQTEGEIVVRGRQSGDRMRLSGGTKSLKELFIDKKIPAHMRGMIPVVADDRGVLGVYGIGANLDRHMSNQPGVLIRFERLPI